MLKLANRCAEVSHCAVTSGWQRRQVSAPIAVLTGHDGPELGALVWLTADDTADNRVGLRAAVEKHNAAHPQSSARIGRVLVLADPPSIDAQEITDKGYVNQRAVPAHRAADVARLHDEDGPEVLVFAAM